MPLAENITRREITNIIRAELAGIKESLKVNDLVNYDEAVKILGIKPASFSVYISRGVISVASTNAAGAKFFSRKELTGLKKQLNGKKNGNV